MRNLRKCGGCAGRVALVIGIGVLVLLLCSYKFLLLILAAVLVVLGIASLFQC